MKSLTMLVTFLLSALLFPINTVLAFNCASQAEIPETECNALNALYTSTNGAGWINSEGWLGVLPCSAYGITCNASGEKHVTLLMLNSNQLSGSIPTAIGNLTSLQYLVLSYNQLSGSIPSEIDTLVNLTKLELDHNQLTGSIPSELWNLTNLEYLYLRYNLISGSIPHEIGNLTKLIHLFLNDNRLSGPIPSEIGNLPNLIWLNLRSNQLSGSLPAEIGNLTTLNFLNLGNNQLCGDIPASLTKLIYLVDINGISIINNYLYTSDPVLDAFLILKGGEWESTQQSHYCSPPPDEPYTFPWIMFMPVINGQ